MSSNATVAATGVPSPEAPHNGRRRLLLRLLALVLILAAAGFTAWYFLEGRWYESTDDAYVNGNIVQITPQIAATVVTIGADDGDLVHAGDVLVKLDPADAEIALMRAEANLANTVRRVRGLYSTVAGAQAELAQRKVALDRARADFSRRRNLAESGAISAEELAHARDTLDAAEQGLASSEQQLQTNKVLVDDTVVTSHPDVKAAAAQVRDAYLQLARTTLVAPVTGYVAKRTVQVGQRVQIGAPLMAVVPLHQVWIDANFKETQLTQMRLGQPAEVTVDVYGGGVKYKAVVESLGVGTGSAFSLLPAQNATGNWIKIVQRLPVRVYFTDPKQLDEHPLRIGLSSYVHVNLHDQNGPMLARQAPAQPRFTTTVYEQNLAHVDELVAKSIHDNMERSEK